jgi:hypothetical protein
MRTVLCGIHLLIDTLIMHNKVYKWNQTERGESKTAERQRKREGQRQSITKNERLHGQYILSLEKIFMADLGE